MKIALDTGHNCINDGGAVGIRKEDELILELGIKLKKLLQREGHTVIDVHPASAVSVIDSLRQRVVAANKSDADLFVSLHFNAFNKLAYGSEIFVISSRSQQIARRTLTEVCKLGFFDRGVKRRNFYVLKHTEMPAILVECCFCDSVRDMDLYDADDMALAICNGIIGRDGVYLPKEKTQYLKVEPAFTWLKSSTEQASKLPISQVLKIERGIYTIESYEPTEEHHFWVELKSGAKGFIYANHAEVVSK